MKIYLSSDHAGYELKEQVKQFLMDKHYEVEDLGTDSTASVNWAEYGERMARKVSSNLENSRGIGICGSGIGMSIVSNKFKGVRAALCHDVKAAEMSRKHNNANVLNLGARVVDTDTALQIVETWLNTQFEGDRHQLRLDFLSKEVENTNFK